MSNPKITVLMNTFRERPEWLSVAANAYWNQRDVEVELIISYVAGDENIIPSNFAPGVKLVRNEKPGIYQQINAALPYITGEFVCYASSNDKPEPFKLRMEYDHCVKHNKIVCFSDFWKCDENLKKKSVYRGHSYDYRDHLKGNYVNDCALVRSDILQKYAPFRTEWANHAYFDLWLRIYEGEGDVFIHNPTPTWFYRGHDGEKLKRQRDPKRQRANRESRERMLEWHKSQGNCDNLHRELNGAIDEFLSSTKEYRDGVKDGEDDGIKPINDLINQQGLSDETHFVYVYVASPARWNELAISIQSIRKNFQGKAKFFCVGDPPGIKDVVHITVTQIKGRGCKPKDAVEKLKTIAGCELIHEDFIYCYDDVILLRPIAPTWFDKTIAVEHVKDCTTHWKGARGVIPDQGWRSLFLKTFTLLTKKGLPTWNYETHLPRRMSKSKITQTFARFGESCSDALFNSLYFNQHCEKPDIMLKENTRIKAGLHRAYDNPDKIMSEIKGRTWLNYSDPALNEKFKKIINQIMKGEIKV